MSMRYKILVHHKTHFGDLQSIAFAVGLQHSIGRNWTNFGCKSITKKEPWEIPR